VTERLWRITRKVDVDTAFTGGGASIFGGRWNGKGTRLVYTSASIALATLETLVHVDVKNPLDLYVLIPIEIPSEDILDLDPSFLPLDWKESFIRTRELGDAWAESLASLGLRVPSVIVPECNVLLNPLHPRFDEAIIGEAPPCEFDQRLVDLIARAGLNL